MTLVQQEILAALLLHKITCRIWNECNLFHTFIPEETFDFFKNTFAHSCGMCYTIKELTPLKVKGLRNMKLEVG